VSEILSEGQIKEHFEYVMRQVKPLSLVMACDKLLSEVAASHRALAEMEAECRWAMEIVRSAMAGRIGRSDDYERAKAWLTAHSKVKQ
jgi:hypothetical protein